MHTIYYMYIACMLHVIVVMVRRTQQRNVWKESAQRQMDDLSQDIHQVQTEIGKLPNADKLVGLRDEHTKLLPGGPLKLEITQYLFLESIKLCLVHVILFSILVSTYYIAQFWLF